MGAVISVAGQQAGPASPGSRTSRDPSRSGTVLPRVPGPAAGGEAERGNLTWTGIDTPLGLTLVARSGRGLCAVRIGDDLDVLLAALAAGFPSARLDRDHGGLAGAASAIASAARADCSEIGRLPLDLTGSAFQLQVWEALRSIPTGEVRSYGELAASLGRPGAARAVGSACRANPVALAVPCHRVVRSDGSPGGYRWGVERKVALLAAEASAAEP